MPPACELTHRILMNFMERNGWHVSFLESDCRTPLAVKLTFQDAVKIRTMYERFGSQLLEDRQAFEHGLSTGRGGAWLALSESQYGKLKRRVR
jgi:hypothetical protein